MSEKTSPRSTDVHAPFVGDASSAAGRESPVVAVGTPEDLPRALEHPAVMRGRLNVVAAIAVEVDAAESLEGMERFAELLRTHAARSILVAGPVGPTTMRHVTDLALLHHCDLLAVMPTDVLSSHEPVIVWSGDTPLVQLAGRPRRPAALIVK